MRTKDEFVNESQLEPINCNEELLLNNIPDGTREVDDESMQLSKSQKRKRAKKKKEDAILATILEQDKKEDTKTSNNKCDNLFAICKFEKIDMAMCDPKPKIIISHDDPLIDAFHEVIETQLGHIKLNDQDVKSVIQFVNDRNLTDLWMVGQGIKNGMLKMW